VAPVPIPYEALQKTLNGGLRPGDVTVIASRPGVGKSVVALDICRHAVVNDTRTVLLSYEMSENDIRARLTAASARIALTVTLRMAEDSTALSDEEQARVTKFSDVFRRYEDDLRIIAVGASYTLAQLDTYLDDMCQAGAPAGLVAIDYLQLVNSVGKPETRQVEVREMMRTIKSFARKYEIPIVVVAQLNREPEFRIDKVPQLYDLGESGAVEQDASVVILVHREDAYDALSVRAGEADLIVAKNRNGWRDTIVVGFQGHYARMVSIDLGQ
jgi:replicative DNA helicase